MWSSFAWLTTPWLRRAACILRTRRRRRPSIVPARSRSLRPGVEVGCGRPGSCPCRRTYPRRKERRLARAPSSDRPALLGHRVGLASSSAEPPFSRRMIHEGRRACSSRNASLPTRLATTAITASAWLATVDVRATPRRDRRRRAATGDAHSMTSRTPPCSFSPTPPFGQCSSPHLFVRSSTRGRRDVSHRPSAAERSRSGGEDAMRPRNDCRAFFSGQRVEGSARAAPCGANPRRRSGRRQSTQHDRRDRADGPVAISPCPHSTRRTTARGVGDAGVPAS